MTVRLATGAAIYAIGMALTVFAKVPLPIELAFLIVSYVILGGDVVWQAVRNISKGRVFDEHFLMSVSTIGAFVIGEYPEAVAVPLIIQTFFIFFLAFGVCRIIRLPYDITAPAGMIGASNFFELAVAVAVALFGTSSPAALATTVGVLTEVPVMLTLVKSANKLKEKFKYE